MMRMNILQLSCTNSLNKVSVHPWLIIICSEFDSVSHDQIYRGGELQGISSHFKICSIILGINVQCRTIYLKCLEKCVKALKLTISCIRRQYLNLFDRISDSSSAKDYRASFRMKLCNNISIKPQQPALKTTNSIPCQISIQNYPVSTLYSFYLKYI